MPDEAGVLAQPIVLASAVSLKLLDLWPSGTCHETSVQAVSKWWPTPHLNFLSIPPSISDPFTRLLDNFPSLTSPCTNDTPIRHGVSYHIVTEGCPVFAQPRRLSSEKLVTSKTQFNKHLAMGTLHPYRPSSSTSLSTPHGLQRQWRMAPMRGLLQAEWHSSY